MRTDPDEGMQTGSDVSDKESKYQLALHKNSETYFRGYGNLSE